MYWIKPRDVVEAPTWEAKESDVGAMPDRVFVTMPPDPTVKVMEIALFPAELRTVIMPV